MEGIAGVLWGNLSNCTYLGIGNFFLWTIFPVVAITWLEYKSDFFFLSPKFWFLAHKSEFCHMTPISVDGPLLTLGMTVIIVIILVGKRISEPGRGWDVNFSAFGCKTYYLPNWYQLFLLGVYLLWWRKNIFTNAWVDIHHYRQARGGHSRFGAYWSFQTKTRPTVGALGGKS